jgi:hypothetical protein
MSAQIRRDLKYSPATDRFFVAESESRDWAEPLKERTCGVYALPREVIWSKRYNNLRPFLRRQGDCYLLGFEGQSQLFLQESRIFHRSWYDFRPGQPEYVSDNGAYGIVELPVKFAAPLDALAKYMELRHGDTQPPPMSFNIQMDEGEQYCLDTVASDWLDLRSFDLLLELVAS